MPRRNPHNILFGPNRNNRQCCTASVYCDLALNSGTQIPVMTHAARNKHPGFFLLSLVSILLVAIPCAGFIDFDKLLGVAQARYGQAGVERVREWREFIRSSQVLTREQQVAASNDFFNTRLAWKSDEEIFGTEDYWATPLESLGLLQADCEDFTIAKYVTLLSLGFPPESLRLVYVKAQTPDGASQAHMVLAWYPSPNAIPLILDNINQRVLLANERNDLRPVFSFNAAELWVGAASTASNANPQLRLSRWRQVLNRMQQDGVSLGARG